MPQPDPKPVPTRRNLNIVSGAYLIGLLLSWGLSQSLAESTWWTTALLYMPQGLYAVPPLLLLLAALRRCTLKVAALNLTSLLVATGPVMGFIPPRPNVGATPDVRQVRVLSYNILGAKADLGVIGRQIERHRPDLVVFSEARHFSDEAKFRRELIELFPGWEHVRGGDVFISCRWPLRHTDVLPLGLPEENDPSTDRRLVHAEIAAPFGEFHVLGAHFRSAGSGRSLLKEWRHPAGYLKHTGEARLQQAEILMHYLKELKGPTLACGDFNTPPAGHVYARLTDGLMDAFRESGTGWGFTYPADFPALRIDYIFCSPEWRVNSCITGTGKGSDHLPVFALLSLRDDADDR